MVLSTQTAIWSPAAGPFHEDAEPMGAAKKFSKVKWAKSAAGTCSVSLVCARKQIQFSPKLASQTLRERLREISAL